MLSPRLSRSDGQISADTPAGSFLTPAVHSENGLLTLRQLVAHAIWHLRHHLEFVRQKRLTLG